jgi:DNA-binding response OmpR family regulator/outer membrane protein OmpA-like peptidoglycan-associated protein
MRILITEDDEALARFIRQGLEAENYSIEIVSDGEQARLAATERDFDLVILDLNLPTIDGVSVLRHLRLKKPSLPVLVLTQRNRVEDRVECLDTGADDYLGKPFSFTELSARIRALVRRSHLPAESVLQVADLKVDRVSRLVERAGQRIELTAKEFALLEYLTINTGRRITRSMILEHVWNLNFDTTTNVVDVYINYASAQVDQRKIGRLAMAIQVAFQQLGVFPADQVPIQLPAKANLPLNTAPVTEPAKQETPSGQSPSSEDNAASDANDTDLALLQTELQQALQNEIAAHTVALHRETDGLVISLREFGFFDSGSVSIKPAALPALDRIASLLAIRNCRLRIEGHTDNVPIHTPQINSNWELSTARATELVRLLIQRYHFSPERLSASGYAEYHPIASNTTAQGRAQNRRVDLVVLSPHLIRVAPAEAASAKPSPAVP